jgi:Tfp pilus assembly protein PilO
MQLRTQSLMVWRRHLALWLIPLLALALGVAMLMVYRTSFAGRDERMATLAGEAAGKLEALQAQRRAVEGFVGRVASQEQAIDDMYGKQFATESERFTRFLREIRELARQAGLDPQSFNYPQTVLQEEGLVKRTVDFSVEGGYDELRRFINFLELSDQFVTIEQIAMSGEGRLALRFSLSTIFVLEDPENVELTGLRTSGGQDEPAGAAEEQK